MSRVKQGILAMLVLGSLTACTDVDTTTRTLEAQGFKDVKTEGYSLFGCSEEDFFHTKFTATSVTNKRVSGVVCSGLLKGSTVRFH